MLISKLFPMVLAISDFVCSRRGLWKSSKCLIVQLAHLKAVGPMPFISVRSHVLPPRPARMSSVAMTANLPNLPEQG